MKMNTLTVSEFDRLINTVISGGYCIGCGACAAIPGSPISIDLDLYGCYLASIKNHSKANHEGSNAQFQISSVCPFSDRAENEDQIGNTLYGDIAQYDSKLGYYLSTYAGYVLEDGFRANGSSGGMGKWILFDLIREGLVDAVVQVRKNTEGNGPLYQYCVMYSTDEIMAGSKSVYYPVEMSHVLEHVRNNNGRYAIIGIPCFIKAVRLLAMQDSLYRERIRFCIGLICGHLKSTRYADSLGWQSGILPGNLQSIDFRKKIPGRKANEKGIEVVGQSNGEAVCHVGVAQEHFGTDYNLGLFKYKACDYCDDVVAETADISIGDAWLPEYLEDGNGTNAVIVRNSQVQALIDQAIATGKVHLEKLDSIRIVQSQAAGFRHRREGLSYRLYLARRAGVWYPPRRVAAEYKHLNRQRRKIYDMRIVLACASHEWFIKAIGANSFSLFQTEMTKLLTKYYTISNTPILLRIRLLNAFKNKIRSMLVVTGLSPIIRRLKSTWLMRSSRGKER